MVNSGMKAQTMMTVEKNSALLDLAARRRIRSLERQLGVVAGAEVAVDVFHHDDRRIDDDAEIDRPDRQQIGRLAAQEQHREGEQQRQRNVDGHDERRCGRC